MWIVDQPKPVDGYIGESAHLYCRAEGKGPIQYLWLKSVDGSKKELICHFSSSGILEFPKLQDSNWGDYTCQAENNDDFVSSETVSVSFGARSHQSKL